MTDRVVIGKAGMLGALLRHMAADVSPDTPVVLELRPSASTSPPSVEEFLQRHQQRYKARVERERTKSGTRECARRRRQMEKQQRG